jgi:glutamate formiminotransferase/formiminotetrahydrofolate cyclodeaminase
METAFSAFGLIRHMVEKGNPNSVTDAGVGCLALRACIRGAYLNVKVNASGLIDREFAESMLKKGGEIERISAEKEIEILKIVEKRLSPPK